MKRTLFFFTLTLIIGLTALFLFPYYTINPGVLVKGHTDLQNNCLACHSIGSGAPTEKCISCHKLSEIGLKKVSQAVSEKPNNKTNLLHKSIKNINCYYCHTEHNGLSKENATLNFTHSILPKQMLNNCADCHTDKKPDNKIHNLILNDCSNCHTTDKWERAEFKHQLLGEKQNDCKDCHINKTPDDELHIGLDKTVQCLQCHNTNAWKPSTFDHSKYFRFDKNHPSDCKNCHNEQKKFKSYTCYNCHEHQPARISEKHIKEGIRDFSNCVKCHRSGDEDEAKGNENRNNRGDESDND
ncbi:MAG: cytochrome c3 family protein [Ignavibacteriales bacterium]|nr:MAG: cytochrome c3 family protein [Ignavibacteriales bacterium]